MLFKLVAAHTAREDWEAAEQVSREVIGLGERIPDEELLGKARQSYAEVLARQSKYQEAYQQLEQIGSAAPPLSTGK